MSPEKKKLIADLVKMAKKNPELFLSALVNTCDTVADGNQKEHKLDWRGGDLQTVREVTICKFILAHE